MPTGSADELDFARLRALARKKPRTKAGQVRQAWPEIRQLLAAGHSLKDVWTWLGELGVTIPYTRLSEYVNQLRRADADGAQSRNAVPITLAETTPAPAQEFVATPRNQAKALDKPEGTPQCIYDIGAVPRRVLESSSRRYIVTDTRLYVLHGTELEALIDLPEAGNLVAGDSGFGLLHPRKVQWYTTGGKLLGSVYSRDPIRRTHRGPNGLVVETRTQRATIRVPSGWW